MDYKHTCDTIYTHFWSITGNIYGFGRPFPYFYPSIFIFTRPNDGWTDLYIKLWCVVYLCDPSPTCGRIVQEVRWQQQNDDVTSQTCQNSASSLLVNIEWTAGWQLLLCMWHLFLSPVQLQGHWIQLPLKLHHGTSVHSRRIFSLIIILTIGDHN